VRRFSERIITVGQAGAESVHQGHEAAKGKITTAYPGVDVHKLDRGDGTQLRQQYGKNILIGMIGRVHSWKGQDYFLDALHELKRRGISGYRALIVGEVYPGNEQLKVDLQNKATQLGVADQVVFTGQLYDVQNVFQAVDIVVAPSTLPEPFGLVVAEGMAARRPVISTNMGGPKEMIEDGVSGFLVPPHQPKAFADRLEALIRDPELRKRLGAAARERIERHFSEEAFNGQIREIVHGYLGLARA
jgi:glycosyltransferase involved in cell wall biosynthesis